MKHNFLTNQYLKDALLLEQDLSIAEKTVAWQSPANIALIKYWGKRGEQLPDNPSISFTLSKSLTQTEVTYRQLTKNEKKLEFYFEGTQKPEFEKKLLSYLDKLQTFLPFLKSLKLIIHSHNTFPHSAGIASSASSISALALCLTSIENQLFGTLANTDSFYRKASFLARLGSGSACRSLYGPCALWGFSTQIANSSDETAIPLNSLINSEFTTYQDAILVVDSSPKEVSSSAGHNLMHSHPYRNGRNKQSVANLVKLTEALHTGNHSVFTEIVENEALSLHGLMLSSETGFVLMKPNTLSIIQHIKTFRKQTGLPCAFTLDAGPNVHLLYPLKVKYQLIKFIETTLKPLCENEVWIDDTLSTGPCLISKD